MSQKKTPIEDLGTLRDEAKRMTRDTLLMMIDPNDPGHFVRVGHVEVRFMDPNDVIEGKEDYFENEVVEQGEDKDHHIRSVLVFYAAHD